MSINKSSIAEFILKAASDPEIRSGAGRLGTHVVGAGKEIVSLLGHLRPVLESCSFRNTPVV
jgi:hypothetical protein